MLASWGQRSRSWRPGAEATRSWPTQVALPYGHDALPAWLTMETNGFQPLCHMPWRWEGESLGEDEYLLSAVMHADCSPRPGGSPLRGISGCTLCAPPST